MAPIEQLIVDLLVVAGERLVTALEFKSMVGSVGKNLNNRVEEVVGSATDIWTAYREGRLGDGPQPFLGYFFLLGDSEDVRRPTTSRSPLFPVDPIFAGASYAQRYQILCQWLAAERLYDGTWVRSSLPSYRVTPIALFRVSVWNPESWRLRTERAGCPPAVVMIRVHSSEYPLVY